MVSLSVNGNIFVMLIIWRILGPPESAVGRVLIRKFSLLVLYYHLSLPQVGYGSVSCQPRPSTHRTERPWWKIPVVASRHATWSGGMGVSGWDREGGTP